MIRPIYDYYISSTLNLEEILEDYVDNFYLKKHSEEKAEKALKKSIEVDKMKELNGNSIKYVDFKDSFPKYNDFAKAIKSSMWFSLQSPRTIALGVLAAAIEWDKTINHYFYIIDKETFRNNILLIFKEYQIMENVSSTQFINNGLAPNDMSFHEICEAEKQQKAKQFEEGIRWFVHKTIIDMVIQFDIKMPNPHFKRILKVTIDYAVASRHIKRIASNLGLDYQEIVDKQIEMTSIMKKNSVYGLMYSDYGDSVEVIKFLESFETSLHERL